ncbi:MAG: alpha/beta hydrolase [Treponema sp.]|nr:alpha/beta hydrolase [Treponema sp.]
MRNEKITLPPRYVEKGVKNGNFIPSLTTYIIDNSEKIDIHRKRPLILICPGGGYTWKSPREAEPVALKMLALGFHAAVLDYSVAPMDFPAAFLDLCEAVHCVRSHADAWNIDPEKIIVLGFSAGGHLAASLGVWWNTGLCQKYIPLTPQQIKPDALCLCYPVITSGEFCHAGSIKSLLGDLADDDTMRDFVSLEKHVTSDVPPVFMWHTDSDTSVPLENSLYFACALRKHHVPLEYHVFTPGEHGLSLATEETSSIIDGKPGRLQKECALWPELFATWVKRMCVL